MNALLIYAFVWVMPSGLPEELTVTTRTMRLDACEAHVAKMQARYDSGGRWAKDFRHFNIRCVALPPHQEPSQ